MTRKHLTTEDFRLFAEAWLCLARARVLLVFYPFRKVIAVMKDSAKVCRQPHLSELQIDLIKRSIARACRKSPWRTMCFEQALAAKMMLRKRGMPSVTYFGVMRDEHAEYKAHAWLDSNEVRVTGGKNNEMFTVVASFSS